MEIVNGFKNPDVGQALVWTEPVHLYVIGFQMHINAAMIDKIKILPLLN
jgi:hypothetical protein